jgi:hypothetical protein
MLFVDYVQSVIEKNSEGFDGIYEDYIVKLVGLGGLTSLLTHNRLESCGVLYGRKLYTLCDIKKPN